MTLWKQIDVRAAACVVGRAARLAGLTVEVAHWLAEVFRVIVHAFVEKVPAQNIA
jgi:hypothetical protein